MSLTAENRANLEKLASYLEGLPEDYQHFDMGVFFGLDGETEAKYALHNGGVASCGTVACAAGHGPAAGILFPAHLVKRGHVDWHAYCELFVGPLGREYHWAFSGTWSMHDGHHHGAAARIRYLLAHDAPPDAFENDGDCGDHVGAYEAFRINAAQPA